MFENPRKNVFQFTFANDWVVSLSFSEGTYSQNRYGVTPNVCPDVEVAYWTKTNTNYHSFTGEPGDYYCGHIKPDEAVKFMYLVSQDRMDEAKNYLISVRE